MGALRDFTWDDQSSAIGGTGVLTGFQDSASGPEVLNGNNTTEAHESHPSYVGGTYDYCATSAYGDSRGNASDNFPFEDQSPTLGTGASTDHTTFLGLPHDPMEAVNSSASGLLLSANDSTNGCACISCFVKSRQRLLSTGRPYASYSCVAGCHYVGRIYFNDWQQHLNTHFKQDKKYHCRAPQCGRIFGRWVELKRHDKTHCLRPKKFACNIFGCKYSGDNGFIRHDKLLSHKRNVHDGKAPPSQLMRRLQAKPRT